MDVVIKTVQGGSESDYSQQFSLYLMQSHFETKLEFESNFCWCPQIDNPSGTSKNILEANLY
jgi:hypothetical protein